MEATTTVDTARYGSILGPDLWALLADEYLNGPNTERAERAAGKLGEYVRSQVYKLGGTFHFEGGTVEAHEYRHKGATWIAEPGQPYNGLGDLTEDVVRGLATVSTDYCDHPVWSVDTNVRFRIWHDTAHVEAGLGFGVDDELRLFGVQAREIAAGKPIGYPTNEVLTGALFCESVYQLAAFVHLGAYPDVQHAVELGPVGLAVRGLLGALEVD